MEYTVSIQDWGAIGELVSAIAVVVTLVYLSRQIRQQNILARQAAFQHIMEAVNATLVPGYSDPGVMEVTLKGHASPQGLNDVEAAQFSQGMRLFYNTMLTAHRAYANGLLEETDWLQLGAVCNGLMETPGGRAFREANQLMFPEFWAAVDDAARRSEPDVDVFLSGSEGGT